MLRDNENSDEEANKARLIDGWESGYNLKK
jgi:hypothetical protein